MWTNPASTLTMQIDTSNWMKARAVLMQYSKTEPSQSLHRAVAFVVNDAKRHTPFTDISRIDTELMVEATPAVLKSGKLSRDKKRQREVITAIKGSSPPLAALIISAQVLRVDTTASQPGMSNYNRLTDMKYARTASPFKGVSRAAGAALMTAAISRMVKARHSSTHFFQISWNSILAKLAPYVPSGYRSSVMTWASKGGQPSPELGNVIPAKRDDPFATCTIENLVGMSSRYPNLMERRNQAAHRILDRVLQQSINRNFHQMVGKIIAQDMPVEMKQPLIAYGVYM